MIRQTDKTALITGASGGLGFEFAKLLSSDCTNIVLVSRNEARLKAATLKLESICPTTITPIVKDLVKPGAVDEILAGLDRQGLSVDILVNNAGFGGFGAFIEQDWSYEAEMIAVNITALTHLTKLVAQGMVKRGSGRILNVASTAAFQPGPLLAVYYASKAYVLSFSEALANELQGTGVTVTTLCPGPIATGFAKAAGLERSRLFNYVKPARAAEVARYGYDAMMKGNRLAVPGVLNKLGALGTRIGPRTWVAAVVRWLHGPEGGVPKK